MRQPLAPPPQDKSLRFGHPLRHQPQRALEVGLAAAHRDCARGLLAPGLAMSLPTPVERTRIKPKLAGLCCDIISKQLE
jgi:hypothetical protein